MSSILSEPVSATTAGSQYKGAAEGAVSSKTGLGPAGVRAGSASPWVTGSAAADNTRIFERLDESRLVSGGVVEIGNAAPQTMVSLTAGQAAEMNAVRLDGSTQIIRSGLSTTAELTYATVIRYRPEAGIALRANNVLATLTKPTGFGANESDWMLGILQATGLVTMQVWRVGAVLGSVASSMRIDDGRLYGVAMTIAGTTATLYVREIGTSTTSQGSAAVASHTSTSPMDLVVGKWAGPPIPLDFAAGWLYSAALSSADIDSIFDAPRATHYHKSLTLAWVPAASDVGTTAIADPVSGNDATTPNSWAELEYALAPVRYSRPALGPPRRRHVLRLDGVTGRAASTATITLPATYSLVTAIALPLGGGADHDDDFLLLGNGLDTDTDIRLRWVAGKLELRCKRISGTERTATSSTTYAPDGTLRVIQIAVDNTAKTATLYVDGSQEAQASAISAHVASSVATLELGGYQAGNVARIDVMGPAMLIAGELSAATGLALWRSGADPLRDPRISSYWPLDGDGSDYGSTGATLTLTDAVWVPRVSVPGTAVRAIDSPRTARLVLTWAETDVLEWSLRIFDPGNADASIVVRRAELYSGIKLDSPQTAHSPAIAISAGAGLIRQPAALSAELWLTREEMTRLRAAAIEGAEIALSAPLADDSIGDRIESTIGRLDSIEFREFWAASGGTTARWQATLTITEAP